MENNTTDTSTTAQPEPVVPTVETGAPASDGDRVTVTADQEHSSIKIPSRGVDTSTGKVDNNDIPAPPPEGSQTTPPAGEPQNTDQAQGSDSGKPTETAPTPSFDFSSLSKEIDLDFADVDGLKGVLSEYKTLKTKATEFESISPGIQEAIKAEKAGMDLNQFFDLRKRDFDNMDGKDLLREKYLKENAKLFSENPEFAKKRFEREYNSKYGNLNKKFEDDQDRLDFEEENAEDLSYSKLELEHEIKLAREEMNNWKAEATKIPEKAQNSNEPSPEEQAAIAQKHQGNVQKFLSEYKGLELALDDKTAPFKFGVSDDIKQSLQQDLEDPGNFLSDIGFTEEGIDVSKFGVAIMKLKNFDKAVQNAAQYLVEQKNKQTVEGQLVNPRGTDSVNTGNPQIQTHEEKVAAAFAAKRQQERGGYFN